MAAETDSADEPNEAEAEAEADDGDDGGGSEGGMPPSDESSTGEEPATETDAGGDSECTPAYFDDVSWDDACWQ